MLNHPSDDFLLAEKLGFPVFNLDALDLKKLPLKLLNPELIIKHQALPIAQSQNCLVVAISNLSNLAVLDEFKYTSRLNTEAVLVEKAKLSQTIKKITYLMEALTLEEMGANTSITNEFVAQETEDAPMIRFVNNVLFEAIHQHASDLHFEPYENHFRIRFRQDGILYEKMSLSLTLAPRIIARLKVMSQMDISERRLPQDGRFNLKYASRMIDFRVSSCPTIHAEKIVVRVLDPLSVMLDIHSLGYEDFQKECFLRSLQNPHGMILVTGPTGSGKTVSLYTALNILNTEAKNISTCEDPVEIHLPGINQVNVNLKAGLYFQTALRAFLRQDPDVIMVGEIRDLETAEIAIKASQTGHLVLSTLHTNSASETLNRLKSMGIPSYHLISSISLIIAQRLVRRLCHHCKIPEEYPDSCLIEAGFSRLEIPKLKIFKAFGCEYCQDGYKGRTGIYELLPISTAIGTLLTKGAAPFEIHQQAIKEGIWDLRRSGLNKVKQGITSLAEINRILLE